MTRAQLVATMDYGEYIGWLAHFELAEHDRQVAEAKAKQG